MASTFTTMRSKERKSFLGGTGRPQNVYLQFVPGHVLDVMTSAESSGFRNTRQINSIIARPHISDDEELSFKATTTIRYYPLFRGMVDVPVKGDPVLLCTFGGVNYYIGPLNTANSPSFNPDHLNRTSSPITDIFNFAIKKKKKRNPWGKSKNFPDTKTERLQKFYNKPLDDINERAKAINDIHGDMVFEGRHGNSIRVGSRDYKPYMMFSNGRSFTNAAESLNDDACIFISSYGKLSEHFQNDVVAEGEEWVPKSFVLSSDDREEPNRIIGGGKYDYEYNGPQIFNSSHRITINSRKNGIYISALENVIVGSGTKIEIISEKETIIESSNIYLGETASKKEEPLVMGEQLRIILDEIVDIFLSLKVTGTIAGISGPIEPATVQKVMALKQKLGSKAVAPFNSEYHFIESNGSKS
jgi:hypothetical protein